MPKRSRGGHRHFSESNKKALQAKKRQGVDTKRPRVSANDMMPKPYVPQGDEQDAAVATLQVPVAAEEEEQAFPRRKQQQSVAKALAGPPDKAVEFEAAVVASGNDDVPWLAYIGWLASQCQVPAAREVAERAVERFRWADDRLKLNIWLGYLNLELHFGKPASVTPPPDAASLAAGDTAAVEGRGALLQRAVAANAPQLVLRHMAEQFHRLDMSRECLLAIRGALKKDEQNLELWKLAVKYHIVFGKRDELNALVQRAEKVLVAKEVAQLRVTIGKVELELGDVSRGWSAFEGLIERHPRRTDLWNAFLQSAASKAERIGPQRVRSLFERATDLPNLKARDGKVFYNHWLRFEQSHGAEDPRRWDHVKSKMISFVQTVEA